MSRTLTNLLLILIIAFIGSVMPVDIQIFNFDFDFSSLLDKYTNEPETTQEQISLNVSPETNFEYLYNPNNIIIPFISNIELSETLKNEFIQSLEFKLKTNLNDLNIDVSKFNQNIKIKSLKNNTKSSNSSKIPSDNTANKMANNNINNTANNTSSNDTDKNLNNSVDKLTYKYELIINNYAINNLSPDHYTLNIKSSFFNATNDKNSKNSSINDTDNSNNDSKYSNNNNSTISNNISPIIIQFTKTTPCTYTSVKNITSTTSNNKIWATLYYSTPSYTHLIPITRQVKIRKTTIRTYLNALAVPPNENSGLIPTAPKVSSAWLANKVLHCKMKNYSTTNYIKTDLSTKMMFNAIIKTMCSLDTVDKVIFTMDKKQPKSYHGFNLQNMYNYEKTSMIYKGWISNENKLYLVPVCLDAKSSGINSINNTPTTNKTPYNNKNDKSNNTNNKISSIENIIESLKTSENDLFAPLPTNIEIISYKFVESTLHIKLNDAILKAYPNEKAYQEFMIDSLSQSLYALPNVEKLLFKIENSNITKLGNIPIGEEFTPSDIINPE